MPNILREVIPLSPRDCFAVFSKNTTNFDHRIHMHETTELNLILNATGAKRVIGAHEHVINNLELVLLGPNVSHGWFRHQCKANAVQEISVQVDADLLNNKFFKTRQLANIKNMFDGLTGGIIFSAQAVKEIAPRIRTLSQNNSFISILELLSIFHHLSNDDGRVVLAGDNTAGNADHHHLLIQRVMDYMNEHYTEEITLEEIAGNENTTVPFLTRVIKKTTGLSFTDNLNEVRLQHVTDMLIDSTHSIAEIAFACGFQHLCSFNKIFKKRKKCTPREFRDYYLSEVVR